MYRLSTQATTAPALCPPRHGASAAVASTPPMITMVTTRVSPTMCADSRRGQLYSRPAASHRPDADSATTLRSGRSQACVQAPSA